MMMATIKAAMFDFERMVITWKPFLSGKNRTAVALYAEQVSLTGATAVQVKTGGG